MLRGEGERWGVEFEGFRTDLFVFGSLEEQLNPPSDREDKTRGI